MNPEMNEKEVLMRFLSFDLEDSLPVLQQFADLDGAVVRFEGRKKNFVYVPGTRKDRVVLIAHTDTVWDKCYENEVMPVTGPREHRPVMTQEGMIRQGGWKGWGLGADDRAGCAILWLLRNSGHSLLLTDGEEYGGIGADHLMWYYPEIGDELNQHSYMIQLDRRNNEDYKTYNLPVSRAFRKYIEAKTGYHDAGSKSFTDIVSLCSRICGVNLSVGYYNEHHASEYLDYNAWLHTYQTVRKILEDEQPEFLLD